jgi:hypothetical protein
MTEPIAHASARAPRLAGLARLAASAAILAVTLGAAPAAVAATSTPEPAEDGELALLLSPVGSGVVSPGDQLSATVTLTNGTASAVGREEATLELGAAPIDDRAALTAWLDGDLSAIDVPFTETSLTEVGRVDIDAVAAGDDESAPVIVPGDDPAWNDRGPGVYPLLARAQVDGTSLVSTSVVIVPDDESEIDVGVVVPITGPATGDGLLPADTLATLTAPDGELTAQLDAVTGTEAILAVDPALAASIRVLGTSAPETARDWLRRLLALPNSRFALQFGDADLAAQAQAGLDTPLEPTSLVAYITPENIEPPTPSPAPSSTASPTPTATPTPSADGPVLPTLDELTAIGDDTTRGVLWPATGTAGADVVAWAGGVSDDGGPSLTLVPSDTTTGAGSTPARAIAGDAQLLVYDARATAALTRGADADGFAPRAAALTAATAQLVLAGAESGDQPLLVAIDRGEARERAGLRAAIAAASDAPGARPIDLESLAGATPVASEVLDIPADAARVGELTALLDEESELESFASILDDAALLTGPERARILHLIGNAWDDDEAAREAVAAHREQTRATMDAVGVLPSSVVNLISYGADLGPWVRNDLPYPVNVVLTAQPDDPRLVVESRIEVRAEANQNTRVQVPVQARVGNGAVSIAFQLYSPTGVAIGTLQTADVEVRAEWETYGLVILGVLMVGFIGVGIFRTVRHRRRAKGTPVEPVDADAVDAALHPTVTVDDAALEPPGGTDPPR